MAFKKLNQVLAVEKSIRTKQENVFTQVYQSVSKVDLLTGFARNYTPKNDDGEKLPPEKKLVQLKAEDAIVQAQDALRQLSNIIAVKDATNQGAKADIVIDGAVMVKDVPAVHLLFLEKRLIAIMEFISKIPTLSQDASWKKNEGMGLYETEPTESFKTKKVEDFKVVLQPTKEHPGQVQKVVEDQIVGSWKTVNFSGAITEDRKKAMMAKAEKVQQAVKVAREEANQAPVVELATGTLFDFILAP